MESFIVENAGNTCYIDSLLMALFYSNTHLEYLLCKEIKNTMGIYLQEYIKGNFVNSVRNNKSVLSVDIEMIRTLCFQLGWRKNNLNSSQQNEEYTKQQDVNEFFTFLTEIFENEQVEIIRNTISEELVEKNEIGSKEQIPFIPLSIPENKTVTTVKQMLHNWLFDNILDFKRNIITENGQLETFVRGLNTYSICNIPNMIALSINRFNNDGTRINIDIIIQKKISISNKDNFMNNTELFFHSAICHRGTSTKSGHYYTLLSNNNKWYLFDDLKTPCMKEVSMKDTNVTNSIKKDCVFLIYRLL